MSVYIGAVTGFIFLITLCFCIGDLDATAGTSTGVPVLEIFYNSTGSVGGSCALASLITVIVLICANSLMTEGSRAVFAFARDHGLPFSGIFSRVDKKNQVPIFAILLTAVVQLAFNSIYFGTVTGFNTIISIATEGFYVSYAIPLLARIMAHVYGQGQELRGPYHLGRWGLPLNIAGFLFLTFAVVVFNLPTASPVTEENMNYCSAAIGVIMVISAVTWFTTGKKHFTGPQTETEGMLVEAEPGAVTRSAEAKELKA